MIGNRMTGERMTTDQNRYIRGKRSSNKEIESNVSGNKGGEVTISLLLQVEKRMLESICFFCSTLLQLWPKGSFQERLQKCTSTNAAAKRCHVHVPRGFEKRYAQVTHNEKSCRVRWVQKLKFLIKYVRLGFISLYILSNDVNILATVSPVGNWTIPPDKFMINNCNNQLSTVYL